MTAPIYYRWTFSPQTGEVTLAHNQDPELQFHSDIEKKMNQANLIHGYAYPIIGGVRVTDQDHDAVDDPYVARKVLEAIQSASADPSARVPQS